MERTQLDIQRMIDEHDFGSMDELQEFLNQSVVGKEIPHQGEMTLLEQAQDVVYQAFEARGRKQIQLVRKALKICPDCADAHVLLAERCSDIEKARNYYAEGVAAGERALGEKFFEEESGHFWGILQTRPYMRARFGLAQCLEELGDLDEAVHHYRELFCPPFFCTLSVRTAIGTWQSFSSKREQTSTQKPGTMLLRYMQSGMTTQMSSNYFCPMVPTQMKKTERTGHFCITRLTQRKRI